MHRSKLPVSLSTDGQTSLSTDTVPIGYGTGSIPVPESEKTLMLVEYQYR